MEEVSAPPYQDHSDLPRVVPTAPDLPGENTIDDDSPPPYSAVASPSSVNTSHYTLPPVTMIS